MTLYANMMTDLLAAMPTEELAKIRFACMFTVLVGGIAGGYLASTRLGLDEGAAKKLMNFVMVVLNWPATLVAIWQMEMRWSVLTVPVMGVVLLFASSIFALIVFRFHKLDVQGRLTAVMAGGLANLSHTGGAFVCYAIFGLEGYALGQLYLALWLPTVYIMWMPILKAYEQRNLGRKETFSGRDLFDARLMGLWAMVVGLALNFSHLATPAVLTRWYVMDPFIYAASGLSFFAIGMRLSISRLKNYIPLYFTLGAVRFVLTPAAAALILWLCSGWFSNLSDLSRKVIMVQSTAPCAVLMVTMANIFDLDSRMGSALWVVNTAVFAVVVTPILFVIYTWH
jgi:predicted permease